MRKRTEMGAKVRDCVGITNNDHDGSFVSSPLCFFLSWPPHFCACSEFDRFANLKIPPSRRNDGGVAAVEAAEALCRGD